MATINFNGQEYDSPDAMPPDVRKLYDMANSMLEDKNQNGMPDLFENMGMSQTPTVMHSAQYVIDGTSYASLESMPPEARQRYEQAMKRLDGNNNGVPDLFEAFAQPQAPTSTQSPGVPHVTVVGESRRTPAVLLIGLMVVVLVVAVVMIWYINN